MKKNENMISFVLGIISAVLSGLTFLIVLFFAELTEDGGLGFQSMLVILGLVFNILSLVWANSNTKKNAIWTHCIRDIVPFLEEGSSLLLMPF